MLLDSHCHLTGDYLRNADLDGILNRARLAGVSGLLAVGTDLDDSGNTLKLATEHENICVSLGVHPHEAKTWDSCTEQGLVELLSSPLALFVGETGLDWHYDHSPREQQEYVFRSQIRLAVKLGKPLMVHSRSAPQATLQILEEEGASRVGGIIHCFTEDVAFAERAVDMGFYISFSGILTFPKKNEAIKEAAVRVPENRLLVETDAPFLSPVPHRGKTNEPSFVTHIAKCLAGLRGVDVTRIHAVTTDNMRELTGWPV